MSQTRQRAHLSGTISRVLRAGGNGEPYRALVETPRDGVVLLTSRTPLDAKPGDDVVVTGWLHRETDSRIVGEITVDDPNPAYNRLRRLLAGGAQILSFGPAAAERPFTSLARLLPADVWAFFHRRDKVTVIEAATASRDPVVAWAAGLMRDASPGTVITIASPELFAPTDFGTAPILPRALERKARAALTQLPASLDEGVLAPLMRTILDPSGKVIDNGGGYGRLRSRMPLVIPFRRIETGRSFLASLSDLNAAEFAPRRHLPAQFRQGFVLTHELAHAVQHDWQTKAELGPRATARWGECFADAFALLAMAQKTRDFASLEQIAEIRRINLIQGNLVHWTGPACGDTLTLVRGLDARGALAALSVRDMLGMARDIATRAALNDATLEQILAIRNGTLGQHGLQPRPITQTMPHKDGMIADDTGGRAPLAAVRAEFATAGGSRFGAWRIDFERALRAVDASYLTAAEQAAPDGALRVAEIMIADLHDSILAGGGDAEARERVLAQELREVKAGPAGVARNLRLTLLDGEWDSHLRARAAERPAQRQAEPAYTVIRPAPAADSIAEAMALPPLKRIEAYHAALTAELVAVNRAVDGGAAPALLAEAGRLERRRLDFAHALRIDSAAWQMAGKTMTGHPLLARIGQDAVAKPQGYSAGTMHDGRRQLAQALREPLPLAVTGDTKATPEPAKPGPGMGPR